MLLQVMKISWKKSLAALLLLSMASPTFAGQSLANQEVSFSDIQGHWAESKIRDWMNEGWVRGYADHSFKPDKVITRAEFMSLVNRAFGYTGQAVVRFQDVAEDAWYYQAVSAASAAGYIHGYADQTIKPQAPLTRQEAARIIAGIMNLEENEEAAAVFTDSASIAAWSKGAVGAVVAQDVITGYEDGSFKPLQSITRAEAVAALVNALDVSGAVEVSLSAVRHGANADDDVLKNIAATNPFIQILDGFDQIWSMNQADWRTGAALTKEGANGKVAKYGDGPTPYFDGYKNDAKAVVADQKTYAKEEIRNQAAWVANIKYVEDVTQNRTDEEALAAYYDDQRDKIYSMMDAFGPLANTYVDIIKPMTSVERNIDDMKVVLTEETAEDESQGIGENWANSELADMVGLVDLIRFKTPASSNPSKYFFSSPRPWRMNSNGEVKEVVNEQGLAVWETLGEGEKKEEPLTSGGKKTTGERHYQQYESKVEVIPALRYVRRVAEDGRGKDGAYPSGHTSAAYLTTFAFAYATPERYAEFLTRAAQMGENRIVTGMHSPLDVIGARIQATAMTAYALNKPENQEVLAKAYKNAGEVFGAEAEKQQMSLYEYAHTVTEDYTFKSAYDETQWEDHDANKAFYREKLTYGLPQTGIKGLDPVVPEGAEALLETRQPYLTDEQRREVLYTTSIDSGYPVLDESGGWGRIDLVTAADGYGAFRDQVTVDMDASQGRFNAQDWWRNDISGSGGLTKKGTGTLTLTGDNSYSGGTLLQAGTLEARSASALGTGDLRVEQGTLVVDAERTLKIGGTMQVNGGTLKLDFEGSKLEGSRDIVLVTAKEIEGEFEAVTAEGYDVSVTYEPDRIIAHVTAR